MDVVIIGAGAAGLMCSIEAGKRGRSVLLIDHSERPGSKVLVSGGGQCNFTNTCIEHKNYISSNPHFCRSALARFRPEDFIALMHRYGIGYYEKESGQLFCKDGSRAILSMLRKECSNAKAKIMMKSSVAKIRRDNHLFSVATNNGTFLSDSLVVATGGLSYAALGASDKGFKIARQFGLNVVPVRPALVPFTFNQGDRHIFSSLSGVSFRGEVRYRDYRFKGDILFTNRGLSGPAVLQISSYWEKGGRVDIDLLPDIDIHEVFTAKRHSRIELKNLLSFFMPKNLSRIWCERFVISKPLNTCTNQELKVIARKIHNWEIVPGGTEGYGTAEVTAGGVNTNELSSKTMESRKVPGLYFIGEVVDVTGHLGGYNLHWAWASGYAAGQYV